MFVGQIVDERRHRPAGIEHGDAQIGEAMGQQPARGNQIGRLGQPGGPVIGAERFVRSIKEECLSRMSFVGRASLQHAIRQFMAHYHAERNHRGFENRLLQPLSATTLPHHPIQRPQRLGGMLSYYHRAAA
jgi:Integrase core domain